MAMKDARCLLRFHRWVGRRRPTDIPRSGVRADATGLTWTNDGLALPSLDDNEFVVWCKRCGKDRDDSNWWMARLGG